jgi:hypothetical protein
VRRHIALAILLVIVTVDSPWIAWASMRPNVAVADTLSILIVGEVKRIDSRFENNLITSYATIFVIDVRNGPENTRGKDIVVKYIGGGVQNTVLWQSDQPYFHVGEIVEVHLQEQGGIFTVIGGHEGKTSLNSEAESITSDASTGYKLYWYKPGAGVYEGAARPGTDWYGPLRWDHSEMPVNYWIDPRNIPSGITESSYVEFARRSYQTWHDDPGSGMEFAYMGTRTDREWGVNDGINIFCWRSIDGNGGTLGIARSYFYYTPGNYDSLRQADADVELDTGDSWSAAEVSTSGRIDLQAVGTHEVGHVVGLADLYDSGDSEMTMFGYTAAGDIRQRTLESGDQAGLRQLYPSQTANQRPTAIIDSISPSPAVQGETVTFSGHGTDSDGSIIAYEWRSSIDSVLSSSSSFSTSSLSVGTHTIYFRVQDNNNEWSIDDARTLTISPAGSAFDFSLSNSGGITVTEGGSGSNSITVSLLSGTAQTVTLYASGLPSGATAIFNPSSGTPSFTSSLTITTSMTSPTGSYTVTITGSGDEKTRATQFTLTINSAGSGMVTVYSLPYSYLGQDPEAAKSNDLKASIRVDYVAAGQSRSETHDTSFSVTADIGSTIKFAVASTPVGWTFANKWDWYGHMQNDGATLTLQAASESCRVVAFFNQANQIPTASIDSISPNPVTQGQSVSFNGHGNDIDGSIVAYEWRSSIDGQLSTLSSFSSSSLSTGTHTIYFKVQDNTGEWSMEDTRTLTVNPSQASSIYQIYSLSSSYLGQDPESVKSNDLGASIRVDYIYQGQAQTRTNNTYFEVSADVGSQITLTVLSIPSGWIFQNKWDYYGHAQLDGNTLTLTASQGINKIVAVYSPYSYQFSVSIHASSSTVNVKKGGQVNITVTTNPCTQGLEVIIEVSQNNQQWTAQATGITGLDGSLTRTIAFTSEGVYHVRARWSEGATESITVTAISTPCIIATAAYGGPMAPEVVYMRHVRDDLVGSSVTGQVLVENWNCFYYSWSPSVAALAVRSNFIRSVIRIVLSPLMAIILTTAYAFQIVAPINGDLASLFAFLLAASSSISVYILTPSIIGLLLIRRLRKKLAKH